MNEQSRQPRRPRHQPPARLDRLRALLGNEAMRVKKFDRTVVVKGLSEREVPADMAVWPLTFPDASTDLDGLFGSLQKRTPGPGMPRRPWDCGGSIPSVRPGHRRFAQSYGDTSNVAYRYAAKSTVAVFTNDVEAVRKAMRDVIASAGKARAVRRRLPGPDAVRVQRPVEAETRDGREATENARAVAEKFAEDSGSRLGRIRSAQQGQFSIENRDSTTPHIKKVRVVSHGRVPPRRLTRTQDQWSSAPRSDEAILACHAVMAELRPHIARGDFLKTVRAMRRRTACGSPASETAAGWSRSRATAISTNLFCGGHLYVDDLVTRRVRASKGHGKTLLGWLRRAGRRARLRPLPLDSGVQPKRARPSTCAKGWSRSLPVQRAAQAARLRIAPRTRARGRTSRSPQVCARSIHRDRDFAGSIGGRLPPMRARRPAFPTMVHVVLERRSRSSRRAASSVGFPRPRRHDAERVLECGAAGLHGLGITGQKASSAMRSPRASLDWKSRSPGDARSEAPAGRAALLALRGVGPWSADMYYLMALRRPDIWPVGDLALAVALQEVKRLRRRPDAERQLAMSADWAPWRSVAARLLWHHYLATHRTHVN